MSKIFVPAKWNVPTVSQSVDTFKKKKKKLRSFGLSITNFPKCPLTLYPPIEALHLESQDKGSEVSDNVIHCVRIFFPPKGLFLILQSDKPPQMPALITFSSPAPHHQTSILLKWRDRTENPMQLSDGLILGTMALRLGGLFTSVHYLRKQTDKWTRKQRKKKKKKKALVSH